MSRRFSREEKGKTTSRSLTWNRDNPIRLPDEDDSELIEAHKLTLIGRVTNPDVQKTNAVVGFLPQVWHLEGKIVGKELGREKFLFKFQSEGDLQRVLSKAPFHFKKWMVIIQRWEPIFSDAFPCYIPFWIKTPTLPVNRWTSTTFKAIGDELGKYLNHDAEEGMVQVQINALKPLSMKKTIQSSSGREMTLELEYINLGKHCFYCHCLSHEAKNCKDNQCSKETESPLGINQRQTLLSIEDHKQQMRDRKRYPSSHHHKEAPSRYHPYRRPSRPLPEERSASYRPYNNSRQSLPKFRREEEDLTSWNGNRGKRDETSNYKRYEPNRHSHSQVYTPIPQNEREAYSLQDARHPAGQKRTSSDDSKDKQAFSSSSRSRRPALERIEDPSRLPVATPDRDLNLTLSSGLLIQSGKSHRIEDIPVRSSLQHKPSSPQRPGVTTTGEIGDGSNNSRNRRPALERIEITSPELERTLQSGLRIQAGPPINSINLEDLQEITVQYLEEERDRLEDSARKTHTQPIIRGDIHQRLTYPSTEEVLSLPIDASGNHLVTNTTGSKAQARRRTSQAKPPTNGKAKGGVKATAKKKVTQKPKPSKGPGKTLIPCSPLQGANSRKRNTVRQSTNTRKKLYVDQTLVCNTSSNLPLNEVEHCNANIASLTKTLVSSSCKGSMVFQKPSSRDQ